MNKIEAELYSRNIGKAISVIFLLALVLFGSSSLLANDDLKTADKLNEQGLALEDAGKFYDAERSYKRSLAIREKVAGPEHIDTANSLNNLGGLYKSMGRYDDAEPLFQRSLSILKKALGPEHVDTGIIIDNLGGLYKSMGRYGDAEPLFKRSLSILEKAAGPEHIDTGISLNNLGTLYENMGQYSDAVPLLERGLSIFEKAAGPEHELTADNLNNLGSLYQSLGRFNDAEPLYQRSLAIKEKTLGPEHVDTGIIIDNLEGLYNRMGRFTDAESLLQRSLAIKKKKVGSEHVLTATSLNNLGSLYQRMGHYADAEALYQSSLSIVKKVVGSEHVFTARSLNNLGGLYQEMGRYADAEPLFKRSLAIRKKAVDSENVDTAIALISLGNLYQSMEHYADAEPIYQHSLAILEKVVGPEHVLTATGLNDLGSLYESMGRYADAESLFKRSLVIKEKAIGPEHVDTGIVIDNLGSLYQSMKRYSDADSLHQRSLAIFEKSAGSVHPSTSIALLNYGHLHKIQNNLTLAIFYGKQAINILQANRESNLQLSKESQIGFLKTKESSYRTVAKWLLEAGRLAEAEQVLAMLKEDEHHQYLRRDQAAAQKLNERLDCTQWEKEHCDKLDKLGNELHDVGSKVGALGNRSDTSTEKVKLDELKALLRTRSNAFTQGLTEINKALGKLEGDPEYKIHLERDVLRHTNRLRRELKELGHNAVALHYLLLEDNIKIIFTTKDKQLTRSVDIKRTKLRNKVGSLRQAILRGGSGQEKQPSKDVPGLSQELYQLLIAPVADELEAANTKTLMLSLDGILRYLPMATLHDGEQYLIQRYALNFQTLAARTDLDDPPKEQWRVSGFGVSRSSEVIEPGKTQPIQFEALTSVKSELDSIITQDKGDSGILPGTVYLDDAFSKEQLNKSLAENSSVVHIGSHFKLRPGDNTRSFLLMGKNTILTMSEVYEENMDFSGADLVTLSACDTAMGEQSAFSNGAEIESFGVLVQELGAKAVLATLWPVVDESTGIFMQHFYRFREQEQLTKAEALRKAQLAMLTGKENFSQPYYWAPFVLMGNWL